MKITQQRLHLTCALVLTTLLAGCNSAEGPLAVSEQFSDELALELAIGAARQDPCTDQYAFQSELNGVPDDTFTGILKDDVVLEEHWYADTRTIIFFSYSASDSWCNVWNESGVSWNR